MSVPQSMYELGILPHLDTYTALGVCVSRGGVTPARFMEAVRRYSGHPMHAEVLRICTAAVLGGSEGEGEGEGEDFAPQFCELVRSIPPVAYDSDYAFIFRTGAMMIEAVSRRCASVCVVAWDALFPYTNISQTDAPPFLCCVCCGERNPSNYSQGFVVFSSFPRRTLVLLRPTHMYTVRTPC